MYGGQGSWYYSHLAGIQRPVGAYNWSQVIVKPDRSGLAYVQARLDTPVGPIESQVQQGPPGICGTAPENTNLTLRCLGPDGKPDPSNVFTAVRFASFGTPTGRCGSFEEASTCSANTSDAVVRELCMGKGECTIPVNDETFGDPCYRVVKRMYVQLEGNCALTGTKMDATIPGNTEGRVWLPLAPGSTSGANVTVTESQGVVWTRGAFQSGVDGVAGAEFDASTSSIVFYVGSGSYSFQDL